MTVPFRHPHRVSYAECTVGNHVYHSRYLDWLEAARGEFIRSLGSTVLQWQERDVIFPVIEARLRYKSPARYDDLLAIEVWPPLIERVRLNFAHRIINQDGKLILEAETFHVCAGVNEKPKRLPEELAAKLKPYLNGGDCGGFKGKVHECLQPIVGFVNCNFRVGCRSSLFLPLIGWEIIAWTGTGFIWLPFHLIMAGLGLLSFIQLDI
jgi:acyl-CoA thioester hydrolase